MDSEKCKHKEQQQTACGTQPSSSSTAGNFMNKETGAYDLGDLDQALLLYLDASHEHKREQTLNIFPSQPMHVDPSNKGGINLASPSTSNSTKISSEKSMEFEGDQRSDLPSTSELRPEIKREMNLTGAPSSSDHDGPRTPDPKTLRRLAQNREAARKSRLRKKAYIQQLESSRIKLTQIEQELQRARAHQGIFFGGAVSGDQGLPPGIGGLVSEATMFDMEYGRWLEEEHRLMCELRAALQEQKGENELRVFVDHCVTHHDELIKLRSIAIRTDVFHLVAGTWMTPAERCFMWIGGFRPSDLIKIILRHIEPSSEQQLLTICGLQQSTRETEDSLTQGLEALHRSLSDTVASDELSCPSNMAAYMGHMAMAVNKLSNLENFVQQADNLRQQTLHQLHQVLNTRQAANGFLAINDYFHRLRALSLFWQARPKSE